jgi:hypothetical protein
MLTVATIGMAVYGVYAVVAGLIDLVARSRMEALADLGLVAFGLVLLVAAAFVRVLIPGGLALAIGALLGLQALAVHSDVHLGGSLALAPQLVRGGFAVALVALAYFGARAERAKLRSKAET